MATTCCVCGNGKKLKELKVESEEYKFLRTHCRSNVGVGFRLCLNCSRRVVNMDNKLKALDSQHNDTVLKLLKMYNRGSINKLSAATCSTISENIAAPSTATDDDIATSHSYVPSCVLNFSLTPVKEKVIKRFLSPSTPSVLITPSRAMPCEKRMRAESTFGKQTIRLK